MSWTTRGRAPGASSASPRAPQSNASLLPRDHNVLVAHPRQHMNGWLDLTATFSRLKCGHLPRPHRGNRRPASLQGETPGETSSRLLGTLRFPPGARCHARRQCRGPDPALPPQARAGAGEGRACPGRPRPPRLTYPVLSPITAFPFGRSLL